MVRFKNRYFAIEVQVSDRPGHAPLELKNMTLYQTILRKVQEIHGDFGAAAITNGFVAKYCNPYTKVALIRCRHGPHRYLATVLPLIKLIQQVPVRINVIYVGATMAKSYKHIIRYQKKFLERYWNKMKTDSDRMLMKEALYNVTEMSIKKAKEK